MGAIAAGAAGGRKRGSVLRTCACRVPDRRLNIFNIQVFNSDILKNWIYMVWTNFFIAPEPKFNLETTEPRFDLNSNFSTFKFFFFHNFQIKRDVLYIAPVHLRWQFCLN